MDTFEPRTFDILEATTGQYTATIVGNDGITPLPLATLSTLTMSLYVVKQDGSIAFVNGRNAQNILNANNVTVSAGGVLNWTIQTADTTFIESTLPFERHIAVFQWTWPGGTGKHERVLVVKNLLVP